jgi:hypothetical protein
MAIVTRPFYSKNWLFRHDDFCETQSLKVLEVISQWTVPWGWGSLDEFWPILVEKVVNNPHSGTTVKQRCIGEGRNEHLHYQLIIYDISTPGFFSKCP